MKNDPYYYLEPRQVWWHFAALNDIPRPSGQEAAARDYVRQLAMQSGVKAITDIKGNVVVSIPARGDCLPDSPIAAIQSHLDMVCEKRPDVDHNFVTDPIRPRREGDFIYATGTTLGADNGIGVALALAVLTEPGLCHGPLELIFTVEEEIGLYGAMELDADSFSAKMLINLDSIDPDEIIIGCAGGAGTSLQLPRISEVTPDGWHGFEITVSGLKGGHSGAQIHEPLANAIKVLTQAIINAQNDGVDLRLSTLNGGTAHNAIPRDAYARVAVAPEEVSALQNSIDRTLGVLRAQWGKDEPNLSLELQATQSVEPVMTSENQDALLSLLTTLPHGVLQWSERFPGKVQTSTNLSGVSTQQETIVIETSSRSFLDAELQQVQEEIQTLGRNAHATIEVRDGYPGWEPNADSRLLQAALKAYEDAYDKSARVEIIHAGLECGVIAAKKPGLEAISFGPHIQDLHTPEERVSISSVQATWNFLTNLLSTLGRNT